MPFKDRPIRRKVMAVSMLTSLTVLLLTAAAFTAYDSFSFHQTRLRNLATTAAIVADPSARALALHDGQGAGALLAALQADPHIVAAALYDRAGALFARYPAQRPVSAFPLVPGQPGYRYERGHVVFFEPLRQDGRQLGVLYLKSDLRPVYLRLRLYGGIALLVVLGSALVALWLSNALQRRITQPILDLVDAARLVSERGDFSLRAPKAGADETGLLADAFNQMLSRLGEQRVALRANEETRSFLAAIVDSSDEAIVGKDLRGQVVSWNSGAERMFGYTPAEMVGQSIRRLISPDRPEEEARILEEVKQGTIRHYETIRIHKDGRPIEVSLTLSPIRNAGGEIIGVSSISRDITERKRVERALVESQGRLSGVIGSAMDAIVSVDAGQRVTLFNAAAETMFRCPVAEALGQPLDRFIPTRFREAHRAHVAKFGETGVTSRAMGHLQPLAGLRADGEEFPIEASISQIEVGGQQIYTVILRDITERKQAEEQILRLNAELEQRVQARTAELTATNKELESFTYSVAHDLRAPLRHMDAFAKILQEDFAAALPAQAQQYIEKIRRGSRNMSLLVDDLLNLARVGRQELQCQPIALGGLVNQVVADLQGETSGRSIEWRIQPLPTVECDSGLIRQVFANLLSNALKYTRPRPCAIIEVGCLKRDGDTALFVRDNGVGFSMKYADKLFGLFQRLHRSEDFEGTGVGLATVDRIVRKHGGSVWAEGVVGKGATFYFTLKGLE